MAERKRAPGNSAEKGSKGAAGSLHEKMSGGEY